MYKLAIHFEELLKNIQPPPHRLDAARDLPPKVRNYLKSHYSFKTVDPFSRLAGSYAQHTCVGDVKDVDFLIVVDGDPGKNEPEAKQVVQDLKVALDGLPKSLGYEAGEVLIERNRRSIHVYLKGEDFHIDVVPCIAPNDIDDLIYIPDRNWNKWIESQPIGYAKYITKLNNNSHYKVRPLIKLLKHFRNEQMKNRRPKSYWLGALVIYHICRDDGLDTTLSIGELFHNLVDEIYTQYDHLLWTSKTATPNIPDPMLGHNISWNWSRTHFETFMRRLDEARRYSDKALNTDIKEDAIEYWQKIFGDSFPTEVGEAIKSLARQHWPGQSMVTTSGLIVPATTTVSNTLPVQPTKYHGSL